MTLEFVAGRLAAKPPRDGDHSEIVAGLTQHMVRCLPHHWLYDGRGLRAGASLDDRLRPDGVLAPRRHFTGHGEWSDPVGVLMTVEVTSRDAGANTLNRVEKRDGYAAAGIPVYLLIDRDESLVIAFSTPCNGVYRHAVPTAFGVDVELPGPVGIALPTGRLTGFPD